MEESTAAGPRVIDDFLPKQVLRQVVADWPAADWPGWVGYDSKQQRKLACNDEALLPDSARRALRRMADHFAEQSLLDDPSRHGAGLHMMPPGSFVDWHLDCDRHPSLPWRRAINAIVYVSPWEPGDGGELLFGGRPDDPEANVIEPQPGRLAWWWCGEATWHAVRPVVNRPRCSLAVYLWQREPNFQGQRPKAVWA